MNAREVLARAGATLQNRMRSNILKRAGPGLADARRGAVSNCNFAGIEYPAMVTPTTSCPWLSTVPNCNNLTIGGNPIFILDDFLEEALCEFLHDTYMDATNSCFKHVQANFCAYVDLSSVGYRRFSTVTTENDLSVDVITYPICNSHCTTMFDSCYDPLFHSISATLNEFKQEPFYESYRDDVCGLFNSACEHDCDCGEIGKTCLVDITDSGSICMDHCVNNNDCEDGDICVESRQAPYPDHTCACEKTDETQAPTYPNPTTENRLEYCSMFNSGATGEGACCTPKNEEVLNVFPPVCNEALPSTCKTYFKAMDCMKCSPELLQFQGTRTNSRDEEEEVLFVCQSWVDDVWKTCQNTKICTPGERCLTAGDCTTMNQVVSPDGTEWTTQENFEIFAEKSYGLGWEIVDDVANPDAPCWRYDVSSASTASISAVFLSAFLLLTTSLLSF